MSLTYALIYAADVLLLLPCCNILTNEMIESTNEYDDQDAA